MLTEGCSRVGERGQSFCSLTDHQGSPRLGEKESTRLGIYRFLFITSQL